MKPIKGALLTKQGERNKNSFKQYLFLLDGEYIYYYSTAYDKQPRGVLWLHGCKVADEPTNEKLKQLRCFSLRTRKGWNLVDRQLYVDRTYYFYTEEFSEMNEWMALCNKASVGGYGRGPGHGIAHAHEIKR